MSFYIVKNDELYHFGVKGMKWGVRKKSDPYSSAKKQYKKDRAELRKSGRKLKNIAITKKGKEKMHNREKDFDKKYDKYVESQAAYNKERRKLGKKKVGSTVGKNDKNYLKQQYQLANHSRRARLIGTGSSIVGNILTRMGKSAYNVLKDGASPAQVAMINGLGYTGKMLTTVGDMANVSAYVSDFNRGVKKKFHDVVSY